MILNVKVFILNVSRLKVSQHLTGPWNPAMGHRKSIHVSCRIFRDFP